MTTSNCLSEIIKLATLRSAGALSKLTKKPVSVNISPVLECLSASCLETLSPYAQSSSGAFHGSLSGDLNGIFVVINPVREDTNVPPSVESKENGNFHQYANIMLHHYIISFASSFGLKNVEQHYYETKPIELGGLLDAVDQHIRAKDFSECMQLTFDFVYEGKKGSVFFFLDKAQIQDSIISNLKTVTKVDQYNFAEWNINPIIELNKEGKVLYVNLTARAQFPDLMTLGIEHPLLQGVDSWIKSETSLPHEITICNREIALSGHHYEQQLLILSEQNKIYIYVNDITERKQLRDQALMNDRLATVGTLAAGVAHEINNPIAWVLENLRYLKESTKLLNFYIATINKIIIETNYVTKLEYLENLSSEIDFDQLEKIYKFEEIVDETLQGAIRIRDIVRDLKGFSKIDKTEVAPVDINSVINTTISMAVPEFKYRARVEKQLATNLPPLLINSGKLHQALLNLIVNAAQAIPEGDIHRNKITIVTDLHDDKILISISDTGVGIPKEVLPRIFDPFFTTKQDGSGTGLGLAIVHEVISKFGGEIRVQSELDKGTTFSIYLPAHFELKHNKPEKDQPVNTKAAKKNVLVIDDEISLIKTLERMLSGFHEVTTVLGGETAKQLLAKRCNDFDVIICDLNMPSINGADLYQFVAENFPGRENNFIFITAGVYTASMIAFLNKIHNEVIEKPFDPKQLLGAIDKVILGEAHVI